MKLIIGLIALFIATIGGIAIGFAGGILRNFDKSGITYGQLVDGMTKAVMSENPIGEKVFHCICDLEGGCVTEDGDVLCTEKKMKNCAMRWIEKVARDEH